jgi:hypothetical protein
MISRSLGLTVAPLLVALASLAACGGASPANTGGGGTSSTSSATGGAGGSVSCPAGSHADPSGTCATTLEPWAQASSLLAARDHHVTFAATTPAGSFLYVAGGTNDSAVFDSVERASIAADGTLGAFANTATLPKANLGMGLAQVGNTVVIAGGADGYDSLADTYVGTIANDGSVTFAAGPSLNVDRYHVTVSAHGGYVYAVGGLQQKYNGGSPTQAVMDTIERATFDGKTLGAWETIDPLPGPLTHQAAVVYGDALYLIGGIATSATLTAVVRAPFTADGHLGTFTQVGTLPEGRGTSAAFVFLDQLYVVAGANKAQGGEVATVLRAPIDNDGMVGTFEMLAPLPQPRAHVHQTPVVNGFVYSAGGIRGTKMEKEVYAAKLD